MAIVVVLAECGVTERRDSTAPRVKILHGSAPCQLIKGPLPALRSSRPGPPSFPRVRAVFDRPAGGVRRRPRRRASDLMWTHPGRDWAAAGRYAPGRAGNRRELGGRADR